MDDSTKPLKEYNYILYCKQYDMYLSKNSSLSYFYYTNNIKSFKMLNKNDLDKWLNATKFVELEPQIIKVTHEIIPSIRKDKINDYLKEENYD